MTFGSSSLCIFHFWSNEQLAAAADPLLHKQFASDFYTLISSKDGRWQGFVFPASFKLTRQKIDFDVDAAEARFKSVSLEDIEFKRKADFSRATFGGNAAFRNVTFLEEATFTYASFVGTLELQRTRFNKSVSFYRSRFGDAVLFRAYCRAHANFAEADFRGAAHFAGWRNIREELKGVVGFASGTGVGVGAGGGAQLPMWKNLYHLIVERARILYRRLAATWRSGRAHMAARIAELRGALGRLRNRLRRTSPNTEIFPLFAGEVEFTGINFAVPTLVSFSDVDLSKAYIRGTNLRGARFLNVNWWQPKLGRNGLYDELLIAHSSDGPFRWRYLPVLEETYRNVRVALEESKNFSAAADFYVGEMEAHRAHLGFWQGQVFSIPVWYRALTKYGTSVTKGVLMLSALLFSHAVVTGIIQGLDSSELLSKAPDLVLRSVRIATLQQDESKVVVFHLRQLALDTALRVLAAIQIALLVFAFRTRIKRG